MSKLILKPKKTPEQIAYLNRKENIMTKSEYKAALSAGLDEIFTTPLEVTEAQKRACVDQMIVNLNTETVNPDKDTHPVTKG